MIDNDYPEVFRLYYSQANIHKLYPAK